MQNARERTSIPKWVEWGAIPLLCVVAGAAIALLFSNSPASPPNHAQQTLHFSVTERQWADRLDNHMARVRALTPAIRLASTSFVLEDAATQLDSLIVEAHNWGAPPPRLILLNGRYLRTMGMYQEAVDAIKAGRYNTIELTIKQANDEMITLSEPISVVRMSP